MTAARFTTFGFVAALVIVPGAIASDLDRAKLTEQLIRHEGKRSKMYLDTAKHPTIGVGFNLDRADAKKKIEALGLDFARVKAGTQEMSEEQIAKLLSADIDVAIADSKAMFPRFADLSDVRQRVLVDMMFNLGQANFEKFKKMIAAVKAGDYAKAADEMKDSAWYEQVGNRGKTLASMMRTDMDLRK